MFYSCSQLCITVACRVKVAILGILNNCEILASSLNVYKTQVMMLKHIVQVEPFVNYSISSLTLVGFS